MREMEGTRVERKPAIFASFHPSGSSWFPVSKEFPSWTSSVRSRSPAPIFRKQIRGFSGDSIEACQSHFSIHRLCTQNRQTERANKPSPPPGERRREPEVGRIAVEMKRPQFTSTTTAVKLVLSPVSAFAGLCGL
jgi:hypothetical protein